jgi:DNA-binding transcriptional LysR family regulator
VAAPSHPLASIEPPIEAAALASAVQIVLSERAPAGKRGSADRGVFSARTWRVADVMTKHALIAAGLGWGHEPEHLVREDLERGHLVALRLAAWGPERGASAAARNVTKRGAGAAAHLVPPRRSLCLVRREAVALGPVACWAADRLTTLCQEAVAASHHPR